MVRRQSAAIRIISVYPRGPDAGADAGPDAARARGDGTHDVLSKWTVEIAAALTSTEAVRHRVAGAHIGSRAAVEVFQRAAGQLLAVPIVLAPPVKQPIHARHGAVVRLDPQTRHARIGPCGMQPVAQRQQGIAEVPAPLPL